MKTGQIDTNTCEDAAAALESPQDTQPTSGRRHPRFDGPLVMTIIHDTKRITTDIREQSLNRLLRSGVDHYVNSSNIKHVKYIYIYIYFLYFLTCLSVCCMSIYILVDNATKVKSLSKTRTVVNITLLSRGKLRCFYDVSVEVTNYGHDIKEARNRWCA